MTTTPAPTAQLSALKAAALYVGALVGPGVLLVPSLADRAAGPASVLAWAGLLVLSAPLAITFATLGARHPVAGGLAAYAREGLGEEAGALTGTCFLAAVVIGGPAVSLIGGYYVSDLTGTGTLVAVVAAAAMIVTVLTTNALGLGVSSTFQLVLSAVLVGVIAVAVAIVLPTHAGRHWTPFDPHGWWRVGTAASILIWLFVGWEAMAQLVNELSNPRRDLPRAAGLAFATVTVLYCGLAVATVTVTAGNGSKAPLAQLLGVGFGPSGKDATAVLAVALTTGTLNVYTAGAARLAAAVASDGHLPVWLAQGGGPSIPRRPLAVLAVSCTCLLAALAAGVIGPDDLVRATSACFVAVYLLALASATRVLQGTSRLTAAVALALMCIVAAFSASFLLVPVAVGTLSWAWHRHRRRLAVP